MDMFDRLVTNNTKGYITREDVDRAEREYAKDKAEYHKPGGVGDARYFAKTMGAEGVQRLIEMEAETPCTRIGAWGANIPEDRPLPDPKLVAQQDASIMIEACDDKFFHPYDDDHSNPFRDDGDDEYEHPFI